VQWPCPARLPFSRHFGAAHRRRLPWWQGIPLAARRHPFYSHASRPGRRRTRPENLDGAGTAPEKAEHRLFPLRDDNPTILTPWFTVGLIIANVVVWIYVQGGGMSELALADSVCRYGAIPAEVVGGSSSGAVTLDPRLAPCELGGLTWQAILTSMFLHGSWLHLLANMWFLWLFGNNVEDSMGHFRFLVFYVVTGAAAALAHIFMAAASSVPIVGASGAISGIMGAYLVLYPRIRIHTLFVFIIFFRIIPVSAWFVLILWFALQLLSGYAAPVEGGGVAFWAHVGGFVAGVILVKPFESRQLVDARRRHVKLRPDQVAHHGWW
jgi:membrane associated rhomboid family serine protease